MRLERFPTAKALASILSLGLVTTLAAQDTPNSADFQIRARIDLVVVPVTVKGNQDRLITGLQEKDFTVYEDGKKQSISNFSIDPVPISAAILINVGLPANSFTRIQNSATALAGAFTEMDEVEVYRFNNHVTKMMDFTTDNALLERTLKIFQNFTPVALTVDSG